MGYITSTPQNSIKNLNDFLGDGKNKENSSGIYVLTSDTKFAFNI